MTDKSVSSQGTKLEIDTSSTATPTYVQINGFSDFKGLGGGSRQVIDVTDLSSTAKEKNVGIADEGQVSVSLIYIPKDAGQQQLATARGTAKATKFRITLVDTTAFTFTAYVLTFEKEAGVDNVVEASANLEISGPVTVVYAV